MVASWTIVLTIFDFDVAIALAFKPPLRPKPMMTVKAAKSEIA